MSLGPYVLPCPAQPVGEKALLLVILTDLDQAGLADLLQHVRESLKDDTKIQLWHPSKTTLWYVTHQCCNQDSSANIDAVAMLAYRSGWSHLVVADNLTARQLTKTQNLGESSSISMAMVTVRKSQFALRDQVRVIARRTAGRDKEDLRHTLQEFDIVPHFLGEWHHRASRIYEDEGFELHDPDRCISAPGTSPFLAEELANITHAALLTKSLPPELSAIDAAIQAYSRERTSRNITIRLIHSSNGSNRTPTRRDLIHIWDRHHTPCAPDAVFLREPIVDSADLDSTKLMVLHAGRRSPLVAVPITLRTIIQGVCTTSLRSSVHEQALSQLSQQPPVLEFMHHPSQPFYTNPQFWHPSDESPSRPVLFYLTERLNPEQDANLQAEIYTHWEEDVSDVRDEENEKLQWMVVPWGNHEADGTVDDMWSIFWKVGMEFSFFPVIFFVDNQSGHDHSVVIAKEDYVTDFELRNEPRDVLRKLENLEHPNLCGFWYCRVPALQLHTALFYLEHGGGRVEHLAMDGDARRFYRPGWPHHLISE
ncbi:hypothetical protein AJ79_06115 [Helicocarpus griseus UAMH5409]|uniref:Uncharacterized protein n=1 Tax=Helicocarpus griseus UAMH5409 TaxID=1447875 RepID=A0A2B7XGX2_9EURO|nr:hypothetical protein AJ79_06115 [Helicocarpus griseus UAMH5409]